MGTGEPASVPVTPIEPVKPVQNEPRQPVPEPVRSSGWTFPKWMILSIRERILAGLLVFSLLMIPTTMPQGSADAQGFNPSDPSLESVERAEENFAGSAFYFIDPNYAIPQNYGTLPVDPLAEAGDQSLGDIGQDTATTSDIGAASHFIRPVAFRGSITDNSRALRCLTEAIYYEAGMEPTAGQRAVAQVILNRVRHPQLSGYRLWCNLSRQRTSDRLPVLLHL